MTKRLSACRKSSEKMVETELIPSLSISYDWNFPLHPLNEPTFIFWGSRNIFIPFFMKFLSANGLSVASDRTPRLIWV